MSELFTDSHDRAPTEGAREPPFDSMESSLPILFDPYEYISKRCKDNGEKVFQTRLLLERVICVSGPEAAKVFYDNSRMNRKDVVPGFIRKTLFGEGGVQGLDDADHKHRKQMFMGLMSPERIKRLAEMTEALLLEHAAKWSTMTEVNFYTAVQEVLTRSSCAWAGVPLQEIEVQQRSVEISALFDSAASVGWRNLWSRYSRYKVEQWISGIIEAVRNQEIRPAEDTALYQIAFHRELNGDLLDLKIASVELVNVIRPIVAISVYLVHVAHALHVHPECKEKLNEDVFDKNKLYSEWFVQEVRRDYPFFPILIARVKHDFTWSGYQFPKDRLVVLDLYGTNHDSATWEAPYEFRPERFRTWDKSPFNFIPQGGGSHQENHRCPGEWITIELMKVTARLIASGRIEYTVPEQDLALDLTRLPAIPRDQFHIMDVKVNNPVKADPTEPIYDAAAVKATSTVTKASEEKRGEGYVQEQAYQA